MGISAARVSTVSFRLREIRISLQFSISSSQVRKILVVGLRLLYLSIGSLKHSSPLLTLLPKSSILTVSSSKSKLQFNSMAPRWKWKGAEAKALAEPISKSVSELQLSLAKTESSGTLSSCNVLLAVEPEQAELLDRCCFGRLILSAEKVKKWIQLSFEEAFFLFYNLKCIKISLQGRCLENEVDTWMYMNSKKPNFPMFYKAYSHLRTKNWVLRSGLQYGVDFVAYRHHPSLVHSEYSVLVQSDDSDRLRVWSDIHCAVRLSGSVAKTLLTLYVNGNFKGEDLNLPVCLENFTVEEQTISRWNPELSREDETTN